MWSAPNASTPSAIIRLTSASTATSPSTGNASPPAFFTSDTVSAAASLLRSATTTPAPCVPNRTEASRPIPIPAPVMNATFPLRRGPSPPANTALDPFKISDELPVGHDPVEGLLLEPRGVQVVLHHRGAEGLPRGLGALQLGDGLPERLRYLGEGGVRVGVALVETRRLELVLDPVETGGDGGGKRQVGIRVGPGDPVLHPEPAPLAAEAKAARAVVPARDDPRRRKGARLVAFVRVHGGRVKVRKLPRHGHLAGQPVLEERRAVVLAPLDEQVLLSRPVPERGVEVARGARGLFGVLRHERDRAALEMGDLFHAVLVERVAVGHLQRLGVAEVDLLLPAPPLALGELHGHVRPLHAVPDGADQRLLLRGLEDVVVLEVRGHRGQPVVALPLRLLERLLEDVQLQLGADLDDVPGAGRALDLALQDPPRRLLDRLAPLRVHVAEEERPLWQPRDEPQGAPGGGPLHFG